VVSVAADVGAAGTHIAPQVSFAGMNRAFLGYSVSVDGGTAVVGAPNDNGNLGAAYVYVMTGSTWTVQQMLTASDGAVNDQFGYEVAISGNTVLVKCRTTSTRTEIARRAAPPPSPSRTRRRARAGGARERGGVLGTRGRRSGRGGGEQRTQPPGDRDIDDRRA
jgi:hypothetical protein